VSERVAPEVCTVRGACPNLRVVRMGDDVDLLPGVPECVEVLPPTTGLKPEEARGETWGLVRARGRSGGRDPGPSPGRVGQGSPHLPLTRVTPERGFPAAGLLRPVGAAEGYNVRIRVPKPATTHGVRLFPPAVYGRVKGLPSTSHLALRQVIWKRLVPTTRSDGGPGDTAFPTRPRIDKGWAAPVRVWEWRPGSPGWVPDRPVVKLRPGLVPFVNWNYITLRCRQMAKTFRRPRTVIVQGAEGSSPKPPVSLWSNSASGCANRKGKNCSAGRLAVPEKYARPAAEPTRGSSPGGERDGGFDRRTSTPPPKGGQEGWPGLMLGENELGGARAVTWGPGSTSWKCWRAAGLSSPSGRSERSVCHPARGDGVLQPDFRGPTVKLSECLPDGDDSQEAL